MNDPDTRNGAAIRVHGLGKTFQMRFSSTRVEALRDVALSVETGGIFGLLGPNGAGKTTLVKILLGVLRPTSGNAWLLGRPFSSLEARRLVGYLPENHRFPQFMSGEDLLRFGARLSGVPGRHREERIQGLMRLVGMDEWAKVKIRRYSKGMIQRVGLAQALVNDPRLVFLDEPTDGVDPVGRVHIREILLRLRDEGVTVFLNSHLLSEVERVCDDVAVLRDGGVIYQGPIEGLTRPRREYEVVVHEPDAEVLDRLRREFSGVLAGDGREELRVPDRPTLNRVIDRIRSQGLQIEAVTPASSSLEDAFIDLLEETGSGTEIPALLRRSRRGPPDDSEGT
jgi:ABC-2 type transport system ATP-binding protein